MLFNGILSVYAIYLNNITNVHAIGGHILSFNLLI